MKKPYVVGIWLLIIITLITLANTLPIVKNISKSNDYTYQHPDAKYTVDISGLWQVYSEDKNSLTLINLNSNCTIKFILEVGGYDYLSPTHAANELINQTKKQFPNLEVLDGPSEGIINAYKSVAMIVQFNKGKHSYYGEEAIIYPNEGIRFYASLVYPADTSSEIISEGEAIIQSVTFTNTEELYAKYMKKQTS